MHTACSSICRIRKPLCEAGYNQDQKRHSEGELLPELWSSPLQSLPHTSGPFPPGPVPARCNQQLCFQGQQLMLWSQPSGSLTTLPHHCLPYFPSSPPASPTQSALVLCFLPFFLSLPRPRFLIVLIICLLFCLPLPLSLRCTGHS